MMETNQSGAMKTLLVVTAAFGGAFVGTLAVHALAPAPALKASSVANMQPAFEITIKTMQKDSFQVDVEATETILQVKEKIFTARSGEFGAEAGSCKLIHQGRILENEKSVSDFGLKEGDFLVIIAGKKSAPATTSSSAAAPAAASSDSAAAPAAAENPPAGTSEGGAAPAAPVPGAQAQTATTPREAEAAITQLTEMGFPREQCEAALRAAFGNPDRAVEYLMNGIPEQAGGAAPAAALPPGAFPGMAAGGAPGAGAGAMPEGGAPPEMAALMQAMQQNPAMLQTVLAQLAQTNPEMVQALQQNPQMLMQLLTGGGGAGGMAGMMGGAEGGEGGGAPGGAGGGGQQPIQIALTPEDRAAVERLEQLGFPRAACVQAYMAAEKNEELAANLLFDMGDEM